MEYEEILLRLEHIRNILDGEMRKLKGQLRIDAMRDIEALDKVVKLAKENQ